MQTVTFNTVSDSASPSHRSTRPPAQITSLLKAVNNIWFPQANVEFVAIGGIPKVKIDGNLGDPILLPADNTLGIPGTKIAARGAAGVDLNVFFVWNLQIAGNPLDVEAITLVGRARSGIPGVCLFEDRVGGSAQAMAHEFGHHLGLNHPGHSEIDLMFPFTGQRTNLTRVDVDLANR